MYSQIFVCNRVYHNLFILFFSFRFLPPSVLITRLEFQNNMTEANFDFFVFGIERRREELGGGWSCELSISCMERGAFVSRRTPPFLVKYQKHRRFQYVRKREPLTTLYCTASPTASRILWSSFEQMHWSIRHQGLYFRACPCLFVFIPSPNIQFCVSTCVFQTFFNEKNPSKKSSFSDFRKRKKNIRIYDKVVVPCRSFGTHKNVGTQKKEEEETRYPVKCYITKSRCLIIIWMLLLLLFVSSENLTLVLPPTISF